MLMVGTYQALIEAAGLLCMMLIGNVSVNHYRPIHYQPFISCNHIHHRPKHTELMPHVMHKPGVANL